MEPRAWTTAGTGALGRQRDVINRQVPGDYDLFVGIMWSRFGTPTDRAGSGTKEEFDRALARYRENPKSLDILFYFKDAPLAPSKLDPAQLAKVQEFKASLKETGLLSWDFADVEQFEKLMGLHLTRHVQAWRLRQKNGQVVQTITSAPPATTHTDSEEPDDAGYFDLLEEFTERSAEMAEIALRLASAQTELTEHTQNGVRELEEIKTSGKELSLSIFRRSIARVADEMLRYTNRVEVEIPLFRAAADGSMSALVKVATLAAELDPSQIDGTKDAASTLLITLTDARGSTNQFRASTASLPRMTKELNVAKRKQVAALDHLIAEFENTERLLVEAIVVIEALPKPKQA